jgi:hypothetical protein
VTWQDLWNLLRDHGITHSPAGFESVALPVSTTPGRLLREDGCEEPCLIVTLAVPLGGGAPAVTLDDVLDGAKTAADDAAFNAFLHSPALEHLRQKLRERGAV